MSTIRPSPGFARRALSTEVDAKEKLEEATDPARSQGEAAASSTSADARARGKPLRVTQEKVTASRGRARAADAALRAKLDVVPLAAAGVDKASTAEAAAAVKPGTAVDGPGLTPPGERILNHDWVQSAALGDAQVEQIYDPVSSGKNWRSKLLANTVLGTDLDAPTEFETRAVRFSYTTQDQGELTRATAVMIVPVLDEAKELPVMLTLHGYSGMNHQSAPSAGWDEGRNAEYNKLTSVVASSGKIVVMPDYIGLDGNGTPSDRTHPMLVAEPTAIASLDAVRAARKLLAEMNGADPSRSEPAITKATPGATVVWGGSQGGHAAAAVARYQPAYAPDVPLTAVGMGAPPLDVRRQLHQGVVNEKSLYHSAAIFLGMADHYGIPREEVFRGEYAKSIPQAFASGTADEVQAKLEGLTAEEILQPDVYAAAQDPDFSSHPTWNKVLGENSVPHSKAIPGSSGTPIHLAIASNDELVDPAVTRDSFASLVAQGENVRYLECAQGDHNDGAFLQTIDDSIAFLDQALAGRELPIAMNVRLNPQDCSD